MSFNALFPLALDSFWRLYIHNVQTRNNGAFACSSRDLITFAGDPTTREPSAITSPALTKLLAPINTVLAYLGALKNNRINTDQCSITDLSAMNHCFMPHGHVLTND